jgi:DNA-nicking Smr family endonuclease
MAKRYNGEKKRQSERSAHGAEAPKGTSHPGSLAHKALSALGKLKAEMEAKEKAAQEQAEAKAKREAEFRARIGLAPAHHPKRSVVTHTKSSEPVRKTDAIEVWRPDLDRELFAAAMSGVQKLAPKGKANRVAPEPGSGKKSLMLADKARRDAAEGDVGFAVRWREDGTCEASRTGASFALAMLDRFATVQDSLDLHGMDTVTARAKVVEFIRSRRARGLRVVAVIHGTGKHAPDGHCVLRDAAVAAMSEPPTSREIDAFKSQEPGPSGSSALLVALRPR